MHRTRVDVQFGRNSPADRLLGIGDIFRGEQVQRPHSNEGGSQARQLIGWWKPADIPLF